MTLSEIICNLNTELAKNAITIKTYPVVRETKKDGKIVNYYKQEQVVYDDKYDVFIYYKLYDESLDPLKSAGKKTFYNATANVQMFVYSKVGTDWIKAELSNIKGLLISNINHKSNEIFEKEFGADKYDPALSVELISFGVTYKVEYCNVCPNVC